VRGTTVVIGRPVLVAVWTLWWVCGFGFLVLFAVVGEGPVVIPIVLAIGCFGFSPMYFMMCSALVGPRGVRRAMPAALWHDQAQISGVRGVNEPYWLVVVELNDGTQQWALRLPEVFATKVGLQASVDKLASRIRVGLAEAGPPGSST